MIMKPCETCGNVYDKAFEVTISGRTHTFDCFECAIQGVAPRCSHCSCVIIGHGVETQGVYYCCAHCAAEKGVVGIHDRT